MLFIPDISGFTKFVQSTEIEHSQHVIAELLEVLISSNSLELKLAEIEGDALFFYKDEELPSQEKLLAQVEQMYTAFYSHMQMIKKNRICPCNACISASDLQLKIIAHSGELQFIAVQESKKPFGQSVIEAHRLLKNSITNDNYFLLSADLAKEVGLKSSYDSKLYRFEESSDTYDDRTIYYLHAEIESKDLKLRPFPEPEYVDLKGKPKLSFEYTFSKRAEDVLEVITNYRHRHLWAKGADRFEFSEHEVTRINTEHICVIKGKHLKFKTVTKKAKPNQLVYGELTTSPPPVDELYNFFILEPLSENSCKLSIEVYWKARSLLKKLLIVLIAKKQIELGIKDSLGNLSKLINGVKGAID